MNMIKGYTERDIKHMAHTEQLDTLTPKFFDAGVVLALEDVNRCIQLRTNQKWVHAATTMETMKRQTIVRAKHYNETMNELIRNTGRVRGSMPVFPVTLDDVFLQLDGNAKYVKLIVNLRYVRELDLYSSGELFLQQCIGNQKYNFWLKTRLDKNKLRQLRDVVGAVLVEYARVENERFTSLPSFVGKNDGYEAYDRPQYDDPYANMPPLDFSFMQ